jgi:hypothetical protein
MTPYERRDEDPLGAEGIESSEPGPLSDDEIPSESTVERLLEPVATEADWDDARRESYWDATDAPEGEPDGFGGGVIEIESGPSDQTTGE